MVNNQLAAACEEIGERLRAVRTFEDVILFDPDPGQFAALPAQFVPLARQFLFGGQVRQARLEPFVLGYYFVACFGCSHRIFLSVWLGHGHTSPLVVRTGLWVSPVVL
jgi:hypothetical protein